MDGFLSWFFAFMTTMLGAVWKIISSFFSGIVQIFNFPAYFSQFSSYSDTFTAVDWIFSILAFLLTYAIWAVILFMLVLLIRKYVRFRRTIVGNEDLLEEMADLHRDVMRLTKEKEKILALKIGQSDISKEQLNEILSTSSQEALPEVVGQTGEGEPASPEIVKDSLHNGRFQRLIAVDERYKYYTPPEYDRTLSLAEICEDFRNFACSRMGLYYDLHTIRLLFAGLASTKLLLLQGISGTGKTSLPYALGKYLQNDTTIVSVQPSWRDRSELFGFFNEFTKRFNETEFLKRIYEASYTDDINIIVLDEMNIARVEYYFAEMLSILEMPSANEWKIELVPSAWQDDPSHIQEGKLLIPQNVWYIGTANNDDSTFAVSDKVYDRAFTINLDSKGIEFAAPYTENRQISYSYVDDLYRKAFQECPVSEKYLQDIAKLDLYVIQKFRVAFGNRIMKQLRLFVPAYVACGGSELEAIDYLLATKVFRKFDSLNLSLIRDELGGLINFLDTLFGKNAMWESIAYLERLQRTY